MPDATRPTGHVSPEHTTEVYGHPAQSAENDTHDRLGRLDRTICGLCDDAYVECSKCGVYTCTCTHFVPCVGGRLDQP